MTAVMSQITPGTTIDPTEWTEADFYYTGSDYGEMLGYGYGPDWRGYARQLFPHGDLGRCQVCGHSGHFTHGVLFLNVRTGEYMTTGWQCAMNLGLTTESARASAMRGAELREKRAGLARLVAEDPELRAALWVDDEFVDDVLHRAWEYGEITGRQIVALKRVARAVEARKVREAQEATEPHVQCPTGRVEMIGTVLGTKTVEGYYGGDTVKMLVKVETPDGTFKVYGTAPDALFDGLPIKGRRVRFWAQVEPSRDDPHFGFFKRPTKAQFLDVVERIEVEPSRPSVSGSHLGEATVVERFGGANDCARVAKARAAAWNMPIWVWQDAEGWWCLSNHAPEGVTDPMQWSPSGVVVQ